jgi:hypothetical protein
VNVSCTIVGAVVGHTAQWLSSSEVGDSGDEASMLTKDVDSSAKIAGHDGGIIDAGV